MAAKIKKIKQSLVDQLKAKGADTEYMVDQINDYCYLLKMKENLQKDIDEAGVVFTDMSSVGVPMRKNNPSTKELLNVNKQMLAILKDLGLNAPAVPDDDDDLGM